jgi:hypothetical protein
MYFSKNRGQGKMPGFPLILRESLAWCLLKYSENVTIHFEKTGEEDWVILVVSNNAYKDLFIHSSVNGSTALCWTLLAFSVS